MVAALLGMATAAGAATAAAGLPAGDQACIGCHAGEGLSKKLANGDALALTVDGARFARSVHGPVGCIGCHPQITLPGHPGDAQDFASARQYAAARNESCRACHGRVFKAYEGSTHALLRREGNAAAPLCSDCHRPHEVTAAAVQDGPQNACTACHGDTAAHHEQWLPNAASHLRAVACSACHAPAALRRVDLRLNVGGERLVDRDGSLQFERRARSADANHDGLDANELRVFLAGLERDGHAVSLRGHVELRSGIEAHELPRKALAIKDCAVCHDDGAVPFQYVSISTLGVDGRPDRYDAQKAVLSSAITWEALRGFYAIGGTRLKLLDLMLVLGLAGGIAVPALHLALRRWLRRRPTNDGAGP